MAELGALAVAFTTVLDVAARIQTLGESYYKASAEWNGFPMKVDSLRRLRDVWLAEFNNYGILDKDLFDTLHQATLFLKKEEEKLSARAGNSRRTIYACCARVHMLAFPAEVGMSIEVAVKAFQAIPDLLKSQEEAKTLLERRLLNRPYSLKFRQDKRYVPLEDTERRIYATLDNSTSLIVVLLYGGPGRGKSTLARNVALHYKKQTSDDRGITITDCSLFDHVVFLECGPEVEISSKQLELLSHLGLNKPLSEDYQNLRVSQLLKGALRSRKILIILDDVWDRGFLQQIVDLCGSEVKCLVTSQEGDLCSRLNCPSAQKIQIEDISVEVARKILAGHVGFPDYLIPNQEIKDVGDRIFQDTGGNLLALASVVSAINEDRKDDPQEWNEAYGNFQDLLETEDTPFIFSQRYPRSFWSASQLSIQSLRKEAQTLLVLVHLCRGTSVPEDVIRALFGKGATFQTLADQLEGRELVKINRASADTNHSGRSWSTHSLQKLFMKVDKIMREQKRVTFESLMKFSSSTDTKPCVESGISKESFRDDNVMFIRTLAALYFEDQFALPAASQLGIPDFRLKRLRYYQGRYDIESVAESVILTVRTIRGDGSKKLRNYGMEPLTRLLGHSPNQHWTPLAQTAAKQVFVNYYCNCKLDEENISLLLKTKAYPPAQFATLATIGRLYDTGETSLLKENNKILPHVLSCLFDKDTALLQEKAAEALATLALGGESLKLQIINQARALTGLVRSLSKDHTPGLQKEAARALRNLASGPQPLQNAILKEEGLLEGLVSSLSKHDNPGLQEQAAATLVGLANGGKSVKFRILNQVGALAGLVWCLAQDDHPGLQQQAVWALKILTEPQLLKDEILKEEGVFEGLVNFQSILKEEGVLEGLVNCLSKDDKPGLQEQAAAALVNLANGGEFAKLQILNQEGALARLVRSLVKDENPGLQNQAAWALRRLANGSLSLKEKILKEEGVLDRLIRCLSNDDNPGLQEDAAAALVNLARGGQSLKLRILRQEGALVGLVESLSKHNNPGFRKKAALALKNLADGFRSLKEEVLKEAGVLKVLVNSLCNDEDPFVQEQAAAALAKIANGGQLSVKLQIANQEGAVVGLSRSLSKENHPGLQREAAWALRNLASGPESLKDKILKKEGALAGLVSSLSSNDNPGLQEEAAAALACLAFGEESLKLQILSQPGALTGFVMSLAKGDNLGLQKQAAWALRRLASGSQSLKHEILREEGALAGIVTSLSSDDNPGLQEHAAATLVNLACAGESAKLQILNQERALAGLVRSLAKDDNPRLQKQAAWALRRLADAPESFGQQILNEARALEGLVNSLSNDGNPGLQEQSAAALMTLACCGGESAKLQILHQDGALAVLVRSLAKDGNPGLQKQAAWALKNLAAGTETSKHKILKEEGALASIVNCLSSDDNPGLQEQAAAALGNLATGGESEICQILNQEGTLVGLVRCLPQCDSPDLQQNGARALGNLAAGSQSLKLKILNQEGVVAGLVKSASKHEHPALQEHSKRALQNLAVGGDETRLLLSDANPALASLVNSVFEN